MYILSAGGEDKCLAFHLCNGRCVGIALYPMNFLNNREILFNKHFVSFVSVSFARNLFKTLSIRKNDF